MNENATLLNDDQIPIAASINAVHKSNATRFLGILVRSLTSNGVSQNTIARETGREPSVITRMLKGEQGLGADVFAAILSHDHLGIIAQGVSGMVGWKAERIQPDPQERIRKLEAALSGAIAALQEATR